MKTMFGSSLPLLLVRGLVSNLRHLCLFAHSSVQHILCCVFALFFVALYPYVARFSGLSFFDCPFGILQRLFK